MGRRKKKGWFSRFWGVITLLAALCSSCCGEVEVSRLNPSSTTNGPLPRMPNLAPPPASCPAKKDTDHFLVLVSTMDGALSALNMREQGQLLWSVQVDSRPLLSSSISKLEGTRDGMPTRLIPSLDGGLYQYDGHTIEALPMTAESLLSSSIRVNGDSVMVGGKEISNYGVDITTGQVFYSCTMKGCVDVSERELGSDHKDHFVITRNTQTVRAVDVSSGNEKWNFSVGQHDLLFVGESLPPKHKREIELEDEDITLTNCTPTDEEIQLLEEEMLKRHLQIMVAEGTIIGLNPEDPSQIAWQHKFSTPVARVWMLHGGQLKSISLFDNNHVPALSFFQPDGSQIADPMLYVGKHQSQLYVQPSDTVEINASQRQGSQRRWYQSGIEGAMHSPPRVTWKPYLNTAGLRTPTLIGNRPQKIPLIRQDEEQELIESDETSLTVWHENYPFDNGYYLYPQYLEEECPDPKERVLEKKEEGIMDIVIPASLWIWWKEVIAISLLTSVFVHILLTRYLHKPSIPMKQGSSSGLDKDSSDSIVSNDSRPILSDSQCTPVEYISRFATDFECIECLGKGGFGIVFEAKNKVDEQHYAVKRISLPRSEGSKDKVLREVKALAKLDHIGIVRFFHAWVESPPPGWQEAKDKELGNIHGNSGHFTPTVDTSSLLMSSIRDNVSPSQGRIQNSEPKKTAQKKSSLLDNLILPGGGNFDFSKSFQSNCSREFSVHSNVEGSTDESGSFSLGDNHRHCSLSLGDCMEHSTHSLEGDNHIQSILERNTDSSVESYQSWGMEPASSKDGEKADINHSLPFSRYKDENKNVRSVGISVYDEDTQNKTVFEDSGCRDHSSLKEDSDSVIFVDSSHSKVNVDSLPHCALDITLSSNHHAEPSPTLTESVVDSRTLNTLPKLFLYIQMQLCQQETLKDWLTSNTLNRDRNRVLDIFDQIVCAVDYVHGNGLIHRDLKPSNIFFALDGTVKVGDFGLVTALAENQQDGNGQPFSSNNTAARHTAEVGTQLYMSPEQVERKPYDQKVDIFSLGMIFLELMMPFSTGMERILTLQNAKKGRFPERFQRELPVESELVMKLMSLNPRIRPTTQQILSHDLLRDFSLRRMNFRIRTISGGSNHSESLNAPND